MACNCSKKKPTNSSVTKSPSQVKPTRPLSEGGRIRRAEKRIIR